MKKRDLMREIGIYTKCEGKSDPLCPDTGRIKKAVFEKISSPSEERKFYFMRSRKNILIAASLALFVLGISAFASSGIIKTWYSSSSSRPDFTSLPSQAQMIKMTGYSANVTEEFSNGYKFLNGNKVENTLENENGQTAEKFTSLSLKYEKDGELVYYSIEKHGEEKKEGDLPKETKNGIDIYSHSFNNKIVPMDYELTEEDKTLEAAGEVYFNYDGGDEFKDNYCIYVDWNKDGVHHSLLQIDGSLSEEDMIEMAKELI